MAPWRALYLCGGDTSPCPGRYPTTTCPEFNVGCSLDQELFTLHTSIYIYTHELVRSFNYLGCKMSYVDELNIYMKTSTF